MGPKQKPVETDSGSTRPPSTMGDNAQVADPRASRVIKLPADVRLVNTSGETVTQLALPVSGLQQQQPVFVSDTPDDTADSWAGPTPAKRRPSTSSTPSFSREESDGASVTDYGPTSNIPQEVDNATMRNFMISTNNRLESLASNMTGFDTWLQSMGPVLQQIAANTSVPMASRLPSATVTAGATNTAMAPPATGKNMLSVESMSHTTVTTPSTFRTIPAVPSYESITLQNNNGPFNFASMNHELMQAMFKAHERKVFSAGLPLGFAIDLKLKEEVWTHKFVEFADLLAAEGESDFQVAQETLDLDPNLGIVVKKSKKQLRTLQEWEKAFMVFVAVYTQKPDLKSDLAHLFSYW